jgi:hypothetical protein
LGNQRLQSAVNRGLRQTDVFGDLRHPCTLALGLGQMANDGEGAFEHA